MKPMKFLPLLAAALIALSFPLTAYAEEPGAEDAADTVSGNSPQPPSVEEAEPPGEPAPVPQEGTLNAALERLLGRESAFTSRIDEAKESLEGIRALLEGVSESMEKQGEDRDAFYEGIQESLSGISLCMEESGSGAMLLSDGGDWFSSDLRDFYSIELGFVVLPSRGAFEFYWSGGYGYASKGGQSWFGEDWIAYHDKPYLLDAYGYGLDTDPGSWSEASDGCFVESRNLAEYESYTAPEEPEPEEPGGDDPGKLLAVLEASSETLTAARECLEEMRGMQTAEAASTIMLCIMACAVFGEITFIELFRRFK